MSHQEVEVLGNFHASIDVMSGSDGKEVIDIKFQAVQDLCGLSSRYCWDIKTSLADLPDGGIVRGCRLV